MASQDTQTSQPQTDQKADPKRKPVIEHAPPELTREISEKFGLSPEQAKKQQKQGYQSLDESLSQARPETQDSER